MAGNRPVWDAGEALVAGGMVALCEKLEDEVSLAVIPYEGANLLEVSLYPLDDEWECECGRPGVCEHVIAGLIAFDTGRHTTREALLAAHPPAPEPVVEVEVEIVPPKKKRATPKKRSSAVRTISPSAVDGPSVRKKTSVRSVRERGSAIPRRRRPAGRPVGHVGYRLERSSHGLAVIRMAVFVDEEIQIREPLTGDDAKGVVPVETTTADLMLQEVLGKHQKSGVVSNVEASELLHALGEVSDLTFDGRKITPEDRELSELLAFVEDFGADQVRVQVRPDPPVDAYFMNGFAVRGDVLGRFTNRTNLSGVEIQRLGVGEIIESNALTHFAVDGLPALKKRMTLQVTATRIPEIVLSDVRAVVTVTGAGDTLEAEGLVVYGDPIIATVVRNRLVPTGSQMPLREPDEELTLIRSLRADLGLTPGQKETFTGPKAVAFARRLDAWDEGDIVGDAWEDLV